ncbi:DUF159-domain-containing protein [Biscogniauxia mediterranea]|nr:DUF159-domain-containing protein [Biscogniauxia mediterranea]
MCGRYSLALRPGQVRQMLQQDNMPAYEAPPDYDTNDDGDHYSGGDDDHSGGNGHGHSHGNDIAPRQSYNFAPGYYGIVYRADVPDWGAGPRLRGRGRREKKTKKKSDRDEDTAGEKGQELEGVNSVEAGSHDGDDDDEDRENASCEPKTDEPQKPGTETVRYKLQSMKWGLVPFWTKRNSDYASIMKTINCRDDSLAHGHSGMWSTMKARKRCIVVAQGFYEWLKKGPGGREKIPHFVKRKDGRLMCFAGLWDVVQYENEEQKHYTYTIITTNSNKQLSFLHDRMPVILDNGSESLYTWLDPGRHEWSDELQSLLKPFDGELDVYPVSQEVGKVGNDSPSFIIPIDSKENKSNIANFFARGAAMQKKAEKHEASAKEEKQPEIKVEAEKGFVTEDSRGKGDIKMEHGSPIKMENDDEVSSKVHTGIKREAENQSQETPVKKKTPTTPSSSPSKRHKISSTSNLAASRTRKGTRDKAKEHGGSTNQKITKFFANSS